MHTIHKIRFILVLIMGLAVLQLIDAQETYYFNEEKSSIRVTGTSTIHNWSMEAEDPRGQVIFKMQGDIPSGIKKIKMVIESSKIVSENRIMNIKTRDALSAGKYREITFTLKDVKEFHAEGSEISGKITGDLFVAGQTRTILLPFSGISKGHEIEISGSKILNMTDFNIEPPTALLGSLKTGDAIEISFVTTWERQKQASALLED